MKNSNLYLLTEELIDYIEAHIKENLTIELLSDVSCLPKFYLLRIFKNLTNVTLMEYVRARKLACSLYEMLNSNMSILDISLTYNFKYEQNYILSFKNAYEITPS